MKDYIGVRWIEEHQKWNASIRCDGVTYPCGMHVDQKEAVKARDKMIITKGLSTKLQYFKPLDKSKTK